MIREEIDKNELAALMEQRDRFSDEIMRLRRLLGCIADILKLVDVFGVVCSKCERKFLIPHCQDKGEGHEYVCPDCSPPSSSL